MSVRVFVALRLRSDMHADQPVYGDEVVACLFKIQGRAVTERAGLLHAAVYINHHRHGRDRIIIVVLIVTVIVVITAILVAVFLFIFIDFSMLMQLRVEKRLFLAALPAFRQAEAVSDFLTRCSRAAGSR
jgi:hypothetical protein